MAAPTSPTRSNSLSEEPVDLWTTPQSLARAVFARRAEYVRPREIRVKVGSWNVAACPGTDKDLSRWFIEGEGLDKDLSALNIAHNASPNSKTEPNADGSDAIGLYILGLQEVVDLNRTKEYMNRATSSEVTPTQKWQAALEAALPSGYELLSTELMSGLLLLVYASAEVASIVSNVSSKQIGTGILGYFGNKGAVATRLVLGDMTRLVFVNSHLASGTGAGPMDRRCWDYTQVLSRLQFNPVAVGGVSEDGEEAIGREDFAFWFGDLNFRLDGLPGDDIRRLLTLHTKGEYGLSPGQPAPPLDGDGVIVMRSSESDDDTTASSARSEDHSIDSETTLPDPDEFPEDPSQDPTSLQATLDSLLPHDQLRKVMAQRKAFHDGWREGPITFLPSYKYDVGTVGLFDSSEKRRAPSWCDRILYRTRKDKLDYEVKVVEEENAKKRDEEMKSRGIEQDEDVLFSYDPEADGDEGHEEAPPIAYDEYDETEDQADQGAAREAEAVERAKLDLYTSHQRITSSDHKPLTSIFTLTFDAVVPELKAMVHAEVARDLDRAENEGRPAITLVLEGTAPGAENYLDFGNIGFLERKSCVVTLANTGSVAATCSFVDKPSTDDDDPSMLNWLKTSFMDPDGDSDTIKAGPSITLDPGETILAYVEAHVATVSHLRALNDGHAMMEDVLVLRVDDGRDHFVPARATWQPTCFGRSIDELIRVPDGGIRSFVQKNKIAGSIPYDSEIRCSAPKELFKLTEAIQTLAERCIADETMLEDMTLPGEPGWPFDSATWTAGITEQDSIRAKIVSALDTDSPLSEALPVELSSPHKLELLSSILLLFLASLTDGLVPAQLWARLSTAIPNLTTVPPIAWPETKSQILDVLSHAPNHNIAFVFLTSTLSRVATELIPLTAQPILPGLGRRLSFRRGDNDGDKKRQLRQRRYAEILGPLTFRAKVKDKAARERERVVVEIFLSRDGAS